MKLLFPLLVLILFSCEEKKSPNPTPPIKQEGCMCKKTKCNLVPRTISWAKDSSFVAMEYKGNAFKKLSNTNFDIAHHLSTVFTHTISTYLKNNFRRNNFLKLNLDKMKVVISGKQSKLSYKISVPIIKVKNAKSALMCIEHHGAWGKNELKMSNQTIKKRLLLFRNSALDGYIEKKRIRVKYIDELWVQWHDKAYQ